jgi:hypothetical protein
MLRGWLPACLVGVLLLGLWTAEASAQPAPQNPAYVLNRFYYYPYYYFPHSYWPTQSQRWPELPGQPYQRPPAYMAYPPFAEPNWRYEYFSPQYYYRGSHFWLDQF